MIIKILARCGGRFSCIVKGGEEYVGYIPKILGIGSDDTIEFELNTETGEIVNYKAITDNDIYNLVDLEIEE